MTSRADLYEKNARMADELRQDVLKINRLNHTIALQAEQLKSVEAKLDDRSVIVRERALEMAIKMVGPEALTVLPDVHEYLSRGQFPGSKVGEKARGLIEDLDKVDEGDKPASLPVGTRVLLRAANRRGRVVAHPEEMNRMDFRLVEWDTGHPSSYVHIEMLEEVHGG